MSNLTIETVENLKNLESVFVVGSCCPFEEGAKIMYIASFEVNLN